MTFTQNGDNASANFDTYNDVQGNQTNIVNQYNGPVYIIADHKALALMDDDSMYGLPLAPKNENYHQQWLLELAKDGNISIKSMVNGKYIGVTKNDVNAKLTGTESCVTWKVVKEENGYRIIDPKTGLSLDIQDDATLQTSQAIPSQKVVIRRQSDPTPPPTPISRTTALPATPATPAKVTPIVPLFDLFILGKDSSIYHKASDNVSWFPDSGWENLGGQFVYEPASVSWGPNRVGVFAIGLDSSLYHKAWDGSAWGDWDDLGGTWMEKPVAISWGPNRLDVFVIGTDRALHHKYWNGETWNNGFHCLGGRWLHAPTVVSFGTNRIDVFLTGTDSAVYQKMWFKNAWYPPQDEFFNLGGVIVGAPKAVAQNDMERLDIFALGVNSELIHKYWVREKGWVPGQIGWESMNAQCRFTPDVIARGSQQADIDIFYVGLRHTIYHKRLDLTASWLPSSTADESKGSNRVVRNVSAIFFAGRMGIFGIGSDGQVLYKSWGPHNSKTPSLLQYTDLGGQSISTVNAVARFPDESTDDLLECEACGRSCEPHVQQAGPSSVPRRRVESEVPPTYPNAVWNDSPVRPSGPYNPNLPVLRAEPVNPPPHSEAAWEPWQFNPFFWTPPRMHVDSDAPLFHPDTMRAVLRGLHPPNVPRQ